MVIGMGFGLGIAANAHADDCPLYLNHARQLNTIKQGKTIILGDISQHHYVVVVPGDRERELQSIKQCVPDAFISGNRRGTYIHVGSFGDYITAKRWELFFRSRKLDARVTYFP
jgi:hypothetical protein